MKKISLLLFFALLFCVACESKQTTGVIYDSKGTEMVEEENPFIEGNIRIMQWENEEIELFLKRYQWNTIQTNSGLRIEILNKGNGHSFKEGDEVNIEYTTFSLAGDTLYNSVNDGNMRFIVDKSEAIVGLHEAVKMLKCDSKARLVIPSYLAYGVGGDGEKISSQMSIAMTIHLICTQ